MILDGMKFDLEYAYYKEDEQNTIFVFKWSPSENPKSVSYNNEPIVLSAMFPNRLDSGEKVFSFHESDPDEDPPNFYFTDHIVPEKLAITLSEDRTSATVSGSVDYIGCSPEVDFQEHCKILEKDNIKDYCI